MTAKAMQREESFGENLGQDRGGETPLVTLELAHRIKNVFAVVSSLVSLSARGRPEMQEFAGAIQARIHALARAHDFLAAHDPPAILSADRQSVRGLLRALTAPYEGERSPRITIEGADALIGLHAAGAIAVIVHELATNAAKYGALSNETGTIRIVCTIAHQRYSIEWREEGGPPVPGEPERRGFGTLLAERFAGVGRFDIERRWRPEGLRVLVSMPLNDLES